MTIISLHMYFCADSTAVYETGPGSTFIALYSRLALINEAMSANN